MCPRPRSNLPAVVYEVCTGDPIVARDTTGQSRRDQLAAACSASVFLQSIRRNRTWCRWARRVGLDFQRDGIAIHAREVLRLKNEIRGRLPSPDTKETEHCLYAALEVAGRHDENLDCGPQRTEHVCGTIRASIRSARRGREISRHSQIAARFRRCCTLPQGVRQLLRSNPVKKSPSILPLSTATSCNKLRLAAQPPQDQAERNLVNLPDATYSSFSK